MIKIENGIFETKWALTHLDNVNHISWEHHEGILWNVKLHIESKHIVQRMDKNNLDELKSKWAEWKTSGPISERPALSMDEMFKENNKWAVDLTKVDFLSYKQNYEDYTYFVKLHIGSKDVRVFLDTKEELKELKQKWKQIKGESNGINE